LDIVEILIEERAPETPPGIGEERSDGAVLRGGVQLLDSDSRRKIDLHRFDQAARAPKLVGGIVNGGFIRRDQQVEAAFGATFGELEPDARRRTRDDCKRANLSHEKTSNRECDCR
jgi:hypothetical protein